MIIQGNIDSKRKKKLKFLLKKKLDIFWINPKILEFWIILKGMYKDRRAIAYLQDRVHDTGFSS